MKAMWERRAIPQWVAAFFATMIVFPLTAAVVTGVAYVAPSPHHAANLLTDHPLIVGFALAALAWFALALIVAPVVNSSRLNQREHDALRRRRHALQDTLDTVPVHALPPSATVRKQIAEYDSTIEKHDARWLLGVGYLTLWRNVHSAEAALLAVQRDDQLVPAARIDIERLNGSEIPNEGKLSSELTNIINNLQPPADPAQPDNPPPVDPKVIADCRTNLRRVHTAIDDYRDARRDGLIRSRNIFLTIMIVTAFVIEATTTLLVAAAVPSHIVGTLGALFALGTLTGVINRLRVASQDDGTAGSVAVEDYGGSVIRVLAIPLIAGVVATIGVYIAAALQISVAGLTLGPPTMSATPSAGSAVSAPAVGRLTTAPRGTAPAASAVVPAPTAPTAGQGQPPAPTRELPTFDAIYDWHTNRAGFFVAILFGLTPELLFNYLLQEAGTLKSQLQSSQSPTASDGKKTGT